MGDFAASPLGTQDYWEDYFTKELATIDESNVVGFDEEWFGAGPSCRVVSYFKDNVAQDSCVVDVGCGNGLFLKRLHKMDYSRLIGVDFSISALKVCEKILPSTVELVCLDCSSSSAVLPRADVVHDKGTLDAIALNADNTKLKTYLENVQSCLSTNGRFVLTSCNFTVDELDGEVGSNWQRILVIPQPNVISFGGKTGSAVVQVVYQLVDVDRL